MLKDLKSLLCFNRTKADRDLLFNFFESVHDDVTLRALFVSALHEFVRKDPVRRIYGDIYCERSELPAQDSGPANVHEEVERILAKVDSFFQDMLTGKIKLFCISDEGSARLFKEAVKENAAKDVTDRLMLIAITCNMCCIGWDCPALEAVYLVYFKCSVPWLVQVEGRVKRTFDQKHECHAFYHADFEHDFCLKRDSNRKSGSGSAGGSTRSGLGSVVPRMWGIEKDTDSDSADSSDMCDEFDSGPSEPFQLQFDAEQKKIYELYDKAKLIEESNRKGRKCPQSFLDKMRGLFKELAFKRIHPIQDIEQTWRVAYHRDGQQGYWFLYTPLARWYGMQECDEKVVDEAKKKVTSLFKRTPKRKRQEPSEEDGGCC